MKHTLAILGIFIVLVALISSCESSDIDERDKVIGRYNGIYVHSYWYNNDSTNKILHDTSPAIISLSKANLDSLINVSFIKGPSQPMLTFIYRNDKFISTLSYHPPQLNYSNDSLYFYSKIGLGPDWTECFAKKEF